MRGTSFHHVPPTQGHTCPCPLELLAQADTPSLLPLLLDILAHLKGTKERSSSYLPGCVCTGPSSGPQSIPGSLIVGTTDIWGWVILQDAWGWTFRPLPTRLHYKASPDMPNAPWGRSTIAHTPPPHGKCPGASLVILMVKNSPAMQETWVQFLGREDALEKGMATHFSILAWRIPWTEEPGRLQSVGSQRVRHQ